MEVSRCHRKACFAAVAGVFVFTILQVLSRDEPWASWISIGSSASTMILDAHNKTSIGFDLTLISSGPASIRVIEPILKCNSSQENGQNGNKLVFIHVFKAAGFMMQRFFLEYARSCQVGWAHIHSCTHVTVSSMQNPDGYWKAAGSRRPRCPVPEYVLRQGGKIRRSMKGLQTSWMAQNMDMIGGHMPLGTHRLWPNKGVDEGTYVSFFREGMEKYVSGVKYSHRLKNMNKTIRRIKEDVNEALAAGRYSQSYSKYLLTPEQKQQLGNVTMAVRARVIMENIVNFGVVVGMTDRMSESLQLIQRLIDVDGILVPLFMRYGLVQNDNVGDPNAAKTNQGVHLNVAKLSTSAVIDEIKKDEDLYTKLIEFVKFEQQITDFARAVHMRQYTSLRRRK